MNYSQLVGQLMVKEVNEEQRRITGIASTKTTDRVGDIVEPSGAKFSLPIPFLWQHDREKPIGEVVSAKATEDGIEVEVQIARIDEPGLLKDRVDEAWQSIKAGLVKGLSIGFRGINVELIKETGGLHFIEWDWWELSAVTIPANQQASILSVKQALEQSRGLEEDPAEGVASKVLVVKLSPQGEGK